VTTTPTSAIAGPSPLGSETPASPAGPPPAPVLLLLTDDDNATLLVRCLDQAGADHVGRAAIYSDGGVSAWVVPTHAFTDAAVIAGRLHEGGDLSDVHDDLEAADARPVRVR